MKTDRPIGGTALAGLTAVGIAVCCGFPVLLSVGAGVTIVGLGLRSWLLAIAGLVVATIAVVRVRRHRACKVAPPADQLEGTTDAHRSRTP